MQVLGIKGLERKEPIRKLRKVASAVSFSTGSNQDETSIQEDISISSMHSLQSIVSLQNMITEKNLEEANYEKCRHLLKQMNWLLDSTLGENLDDKNLALQNIAKVLATARTRSMSAKLEDIIDEIELRAAVELAKNRINK